jgi:hypothetical protein
MCHIENGDCPEIGQDRLLLEQSKKLMLKEALSVAMPSALPGLSDDGELNGGASIVGSASVKKYEALKNQPKYGDDDDTKTSVSALLAEEHWPKLPGTAETGLEDALDDLLRFTEVSTSVDKEKGNTNWKGKGREPSVVSAELTYSCQSASGSGFASTTEPPDLDVELRNLYRAWEPANFIDQFSAEYVCPCGKRYGTLEGFENHVLAKSRGTRRFQ